MSEEDIANDPASAGSKPAPPQRGQSPRQLVLLGAGHSHIEVLRTMARDPIAGVQVTLVTPSPHQLHYGMVTGYLAGHYTMEDASIAIAPLARKAGVRWLQRSVKGLDANQRTVLLSDGSVLPYDWLSINTGCVQNRARVEASLPGAREHGLFVRPMETFTALWPKVVELGQKRPLRVAIVGGGAAGIEIAMAVRHRLPNSAVTLITGPSGLGTHCPALLQNALQTALQRRSVTILRDTALSLDGQAVHLGCGAALTCDIPILALGAQPPSWLMQCGLSLDERGFIAVSEKLQSLSHPEVFAVGDVSTVTANPVPRSGVQAVATAKTLGGNLRASLQAHPLSPWRSGRSHWYVLTCGERYAIGAWRKLRIEGRWVWWLKRWFDRRQVASYK